MAALKNTEIQSGNKDGCFGDWCDFVFGTPAPLKIYVKRQNKTCPPCLPVEFLLLILNDGYNVKKETDSA